MKLFQCPLPLLAGVRVSKPVDDQGIDGPVLNGATDKVGSVQQPGQCLDDGINASLLGGVSQLVVDAEDF